MSNNKLDNFNWGSSQGWFKDEIRKEFIDRGGQYQVEFKVEDGDIVFDFGASIGPFTYQIKNQNPSKVVCIEPSSTLISTLIDNCQTTKLNCEIFKVGVGSTSGEEVLHAYDVKEGEIKEILGKFPTLTFMDIVKNANVDKIDFLKTDCEGGEYSIFNNTNIWWIKENVKKIVGEWHCQTPKEKEQFKIFRETYLRLFPKFKIYSIDMFDITDNLWRDMFLDYYNQVIIYIDNR